MCGWDGVFLQQTGHKGTQLHPEDLCPRAVAVPKRGGQDVQGLCDPRGGGGAQGPFNVAHNPLGTRRPVPSLRAVVALGLVSHTQTQDVPQELPSRRGHKQAGVPLQGEDGVQGTWGGERKGVQLGRGAHRPQTHLTKRPSSAESRTSAGSLTPPPAEGPPEAQPSSAQKPQNLSWSSVG